MASKICIVGSSNIDQIAYVRFASVYRNFSEASDFQKFLGQELEK